MKILGLNITKKDYKQNWEESQELLANLFNELNTCKAELVFEQEQSKQIANDAQFVHTDNEKKERSIKNLTKKISSLRKKNKKNMYEYEEAINELQTSYDEIYEDNIRLSRSLEEKESAEIELSWYKAAIAKCRRDANKKNYKSDQVLKNMFDNISKFKTR